jgi:hypothetical protein
LVKKISIWGGGRGAEIFEKRDFFREICLENQTLHLRTWERFVSKKKSPSADVGEICEKKKERFFKISLTAEGRESLFRDKKSLFCKKSRTAYQAINPKKQQKENNNPILYFIFLIKSQLIIYNYY